MRLLATVLIALPQMVPPGACLCGMDLCASAVEANPARTASVQELAPARDCANGCCHRHRHRDADKEAFAEKGPPVDPADRPHEPGCPAEETVSDDARVAERNDPPAEAPAAIRIETVPDTALLSCQPIDDTSADPHLPVPVYLANCSLLI